MKKILFTSLFASILLTGGLLQSSKASASEFWVANSPEMLNIQNGQTSYTLVLGDTLWAISQRTNLTVQTLADINNINLALGEQYNLPVGRTIYFDGNKVTVKESDGSIVKEAIITDENKVDTSKNVGESVIGEPQTPLTPITPEIPNSGDTTNEAEKPTNPDNGNGSNDSDSGNDTTTPSEPGNGGGDTPTDPTNPEEPSEKVYRGDIIPGVNNGDVGTWTNKQEMIDYIEANWAENTANGTWTDNYVMTTNGYGWIATFY
ncbi:LysM peptidoglycan-binding domain-containing protein [Enterococcus faecalis]|uniref:LysM peptidoglycan-binding domain-containing protein n=1 Tax=Enterococcus faecalis TaxID=1351 RepID=UPI000DE9DDD0|nr:LysM peptidoglycan-binding domain-containing protein [Enterococcus faecalis]EGO8274616.1 LysM peptidoglycan-binding domain-containing protein [Enterococcus faecalis]EGO9002707.1 LysM peptidoglycan-binding domain-containing protein [Enterococcus faecalis]MDB1623643.1 LysM peptidoglycan-binding domain-containing protein [Enterococcus faecalis]RBR46068.1 hypothetical protein EB28_01590 [Enterococcus faecalis]